MSTLRYDVVPISRLTYVYFRKINNPISHRDCDIFCYEDLLLLQRQQKRLNK